MFSAVSIRRHVPNPVVLFMLCFSAAAIAKGLPLPNIDFAFYVEPAITFANSGEFRAPALRNFDPTYATTWGWYPPLHAFILGLWFKVFSVSSISASTFSMFIAMIRTVLLLRLFRTTMPSASAGFLSNGVLILPSMLSANHGRPDCLAEVFGLLALIYVISGSQVSGAGFFLGLAGLCCPVIGLSFAAVCVFCLIRDFALWPLAKLSFVSALSAILVWGALLFFQEDAGLSLKQFWTAVQSRGGEKFHTGPLDLFFFVFTGTPLALLAVLIVLRYCSPRQNEAVPGPCDGKRLVSVAIAGLFATFLVSPAVAVRGGIVANGFLCLGLAGCERYLSGRIIPRLALGLYLLIVCYFFKSDLGALFAPKPDTSVRSSAALVPHGELACGNTAFISMYAQRDVINAYWRDPDAGRSYRVDAARADAELCGPSWLLVSDLELHSLGIMQHQPQRKWKIYQFPLQERLIPVR